jgi:enediyne biosynthesis protein E4
MILTSCFSFSAFFRLMVAILILVSWVASQTASIRFQNVARSAGIDFILENNPTPQKHAIETMPGGVAAFDYDGDGLTDIYVTNGAAIPSMEKDSAKFYNRLYRNNGGMRFTDVTEQE